LDQELTVIRDNIQLQTRAVELMQIQKTAGKVTEVAVEQAQALLLNTQALEYGLRQRILEEENVLNLLLGRFPQPIIRATSLHDQQVPDSREPGLPYLMLTQRPDIHEARLNWFASAADVAAAKAAFYPSLTLAAFTGLNAFTSQFLFTTPASMAYGLSAGLTAPVFQRNQIRAYYQMASAQERQAYFEYEKSVLHAYQEVIRYAQQVENLDGASNLKAQEASVLRKTVNDVNELFRAGYASYLEVITAQKNLLQAELDLAMLKKNQLQAFTGMYRSVGGGWK
jgi:outer membrane protein, multidrug efflux system